jgi:hypothetical protein
LSAIADASNPTGGFVINGETAGDRSNGTAIRFAKYNIRFTYICDGLDDLIVGAGRANLNGKSNVGKSYVVFGKTNAHNQIIQAIAVDIACAGD